MIINRMMEYFRQSKYLYIWIVILIYIVILSCSLTFSYVEGDDAIMLSHHVLGRDAAIQTKWPIYHSMIHVFLYALPTNEPILRVTAILISSLSIIAVTILSLTIAFIWFPSVTNQTKALAALMLLLAMPELFYMGLFFNPINIAMAMHLTALLLIHRTNIIHDLKYRLIVMKDIWLWLLSLIYFGVGVSCRWDTGLFGLIIFADLLTGLGKNKTNIFTKNNTLRAVIWSVLGITTSLIAIFVTGVKSEQIFYFFNTAHELISTYSSRVYLATRIGGFQSTFTPVLFIISLFGIFNIFRRDKRLFLIVIIMFLMALTRTQFGGLKAYIWCFPAITVCVVSGTHFILDFIQVKYRLKSLRIVSIVSLILVGLIPWLIGVRVFSAETSWGPGFELRSPDDFRNAVKGDIILTDKLEVNRQSIGVQRINIVFGSGTAVSTDEGARPLWGHGWVLLGGLWRLFYREWAKSIEETIDRAELLNAPIVRIGKGVHPCRTICHLARRGYLTKDSNINSDLNFQRRFYNSNGDTIILFRIEDLDKWLGDEINQYNWKYYILTTFPSTLRKIYEESPESIEILSPMTGILDVQKFSANKRETSQNTIQNP